MRRTRTLLVSLALAAVVSIGAFGGTADAAGSNTGQSGVPYATATNAFGLIQCANYYAELSDSPYLPDKIIVRVVAARTQGVYCGGGNWAGPAGQASAVRYRLWFRGLDGNFYVCRGWSTWAYNPAGGDYSRAETYEVFTGCGDTNYYLESTHQVYMDPGSGIYQWYTANVLVPGPFQSIYLNG